MKQVFLQLVKSFMLVGLGAYGGGLVTIPLIQHEIIAVNGWLSAKELTSLLAIAQMTPGPIAINAATFVGYRIGSFIGSALATFAVILPSICLITIVTHFFERFSVNKHVIKIQQGLQLGVLSLIICATWSFGSIAISSSLEFFWGFVTFAILILTEGKLHPVVVILLSGFAGLIFF